MGNSTAERVAQLLLAFDSDGRGLPGERSVSDLARIVGRERSQVSRMLKSLREAKVVVQDPDSHRYRLSWQVRVMAAGAGDQLLVRATRPVLQMLVARTGEVALLSVQEGNRSLTVLREEGVSSLRGGGWVGRKSSMHYTASGRALLFDTDDEQVEELIRDDLGADRREGPNAPRTIKEMLDRLHHERSQGFSLATEEIEVGLTSMSVPVRNVAHQIVASVNISGPTSRVLDMSGTMARLLIAGGAKISTNLAWRSGE